MNPAFTQPACAAEHGRSIRPSSAVREVVAEGSRRASTRGTKAADRPGRAAWETLPASALLAWQIDARALVAAQDTDQIGRVHVPPDVESASLQIMIGPFDFGPVGLGSVGVGPLGVSSARYADIGQLSAAACLVLCFKGRPNQTIPLFANRTVALRCVEIDPVPQTPTHCQRISRALLHIDGLARKGAPHTPWLRVSILLEAMCEPEVLLAATTVLGEDLSLPGGVYECPERVADNSPAPECATDCTTDASAA